MNHHGSSRKVGPDVDVEVIQVKQAEGKVTTQDQQTMKELKLDLVSTKEPVQASSYFLQETSNNQNCSKMP